MAYGQADGKNDREMNKKIDYQADGHKEEQEERMGKQMDREYQVDGKAERE